jgi:glycosyltransferase involved in cell wall biosynthesis
MKALAGVGYASGPAVTVRRFCELGSAFPVMREHLLQAYRRLPLSAGLKARVRYHVLRTIPWAFPAALRPGLDPAQVGAAAPLPDHAEWLVFGVIDWHLRLQRPQHLAIRLARAGHRVFYISSNLIPAPGPGFRVEPLDGTGRLFQIHLRAVGVTGIYFGIPGASTLRQLAAGLAKLADWSGANAPVLLVDHPFWTQAAQTLAADLLVYDRMDFHAGFADWSPALAAEEERLIRVADLTVVTSAWLAERTAAPQGSVALIRNAGEWGHFATAPPTRFADPRYPKVIGYYGAIAHWLDAELVEAIARAFPDALVLLIGHDQARLAARLAGLANLRCIGEVPYAELPYYLYGFDVCLLPFRRLDLTLATNPVKVYEYLAAGLPVVATDLPEMVQFGDLVRIASDRESWLRAVGEALDEPADHPQRARRRAFAASQTWDARAADLMAAVDSGWRSQGAHGRGAKAMAGGQ